MLKLSRTSILFICGLFVVLVLLTLLAYYFYFSPTGFRAQHNAVLGTLDESAPASFSTLDGAPISLGDFQGKPLLVNVWASWSPYTPDDHRVLNELATEYGDQLAYVALNRREQNETANAYLSSITRYDTLTYIMDETDSFFETVGGYAMPETILFDRVGNVVFHKRGVLDALEMQGYISTLLGKDL